MHHAQTTILYIAISTVPKLSLRYTHGGGKKESLRQQQHSAAAQRTHAHSTLNRNSNSNAQRSFSAHSRRTSSFTTTFFVVLSNSNLIRYNSTTVGIFVSNITGGRVISKQLGVVVHSIALVKREYFCGSQSQNWCNFECRRIHLPWTFKGPLKVI